MTSEELLRYGKEYLHELETDYNCKINGLHLNFVRESIKALEQESILDKIRTEIEEYKSRKLALAIGTEDLEKGKQIALEYVLAILDKYKAESEDKDGNREIHN